MSTPPDVGRCMPLVNLPAEEPEKLLVSQACLAKDALDDVLWQVKAFVIGHSNPSRLVGMFEMNVGAAGFVNAKTSFLKSTDYFSRLEVCELGCHALHGDFQFFADRLLGGKWVFRNILAILQQCPEVASDRILRHLARLLKRPAIGHDAGQGGNDHLVAAFQERLIDNNIAVLG